MTHPPITPERLALIAANVEAHGYAYVSQWVTLSDVLGMIALIEELRATAELPLSDQGGEDV